MRRVVVTGMGMVSPVGGTVSESWDSVINGRSGIELIPAWQEARYGNHEALDVWIGGLAKDFKPEVWIEPKKDIRRMDRFMQLALAAGHQAWVESGLPPRLEDDLGDRAGTIAGVGLIGINSLFQSYDVLMAKGPGRVSPFLIPSIISNLVPGHMAIRYNLRATNWSCVSACASSAHAIGEAFMHIRENRADLMLAGGAESAMHPIAVAGFSAMHALCTSRNQDPKAASRPFDRDRDGFVMSEGAGMLVLEEVQHAQNRGAGILAELVGYGSTSDAFHITAPAEAGEGAQRAMRAALKMAEKNPTDIGYINAHGTSTPFNDKAESQAIRAVFGAHAEKMPVSSTKSMTGHMLGGAGAVEAIFAILAIKNGILPPTINTDTPDPECDLNTVPNTAQIACIQAAMSNSFGFGGTNAVLIFRRI